MSYHSAWSSDFTNPDSMRVCLSYQNTGGSSARQSGATTVHGPGGRLA